MKNLKIKMRKKRKLSKINPLLIITTVKILCWTKKITSKQVFMGLYQVR